MKSLFSKLMIACNGVVDRSHQETVQILLCKDMPFVDHPQWDISKMNLFDTSMICKDGSDFKVYHNKFFQFYVDRSVEFVLRGLSLYQFILKFDIGKGGHLKTRPPSNKRVVIDWMPKLSCTPNKREKFMSFLKFELIKYRPWHGSREEAYTGARRLDVQDTLQNLIRAHVQQRPLSNVFDIDDLEDAQESESMSVDQLFAYYSMFMNGAWARGKDSVGRPNVPDIVRLLVKLCKIKLEPDELPQEGSVEAEPDMFGNFEWDPDYVEIDVEDSNTTHDWHQDAAKFSRYVSAMAAQINELKMLQRRREISLRETGSLHPGQQLAFDIVSRHFHTRCKEKLLLAIFGGPGTGKSIYINRIHHLLQHLAATLGPTGKVAFLNDGATIHSFLCICRFYSPHSGIKQRKTTLQRLQNNLNGVELLEYIINDEISMVGHMLFAWIDLHLKIATGKENVPFGDFAQLTPVGDASLFREPGYLPGHILYKEHFKSVVMLSNVHNQRQTSSDRGQVRFTPYSGRWKNFTRTPFPLILAWAITIHKSQGMTLAKVVIDTCQATFALTRVKSLQDIIIDDFEENYITRRLATSEVICLRIA